MRERYLKLFSLLLILSLALISVSLSEKKCELTKIKLKRKIEDIRVYIQERDFKEAEKLIDEVLCAYPNEINAIYFKGVLLFYRGDCDKAVDMFNTVIKRSEKFPEAKLYRSICYTRKGLYEKALSDIKRYETYRPQSSLGYAFHFQILWRMGEYEKALSLLDKGISLTKDNNLRSLRISALIQLGRVKEAEDYIRELGRIERGRENDWNGDIEVDLAWYSFLLGDLQSMKRFIEEAKKRTRFSGDSKKLMDILDLLQQGKVSKAFELMKKYNGKDPRIYYLRGILAISLLRRLPENKKEIAMALEKLALESFSRACSLEPTNLIYRKVCRRGEQSGKKGEKEVDQEDSGKVQAPHR